MKLGMLLKKLKDNIVVYLVLGGILAVGIYCILPYFVEKTPLFCQRTDVNDNTVTDFVEVAGEKDSFKQTFQPAYTYLKSITVKMKATIGKANDKIILELWDETLDEKIATSKKKILYVMDEGESVFSFSKSVKVDKTHLYAVVFKLEGKKSGISIFVNYDSQYEAGDAYVSDDIIQGDMFFAQSGYEDGCSQKGIFLVVLFIYIELMMTMIYELLHSKKFDIITKCDIAFVVIAILSCCLIFNQGWDMNITIKHAEDFLKCAKNLNFKGFYDVVLEKAITGQYSSPSILYAANYNLLMYMFVAIIILPVVLLKKWVGFEYSEIDILTYYDLFLALMLILSVYFLYKLVIDMQGERENISFAKRVCFLYVSSVVLLFSTVGFAQLDIFYIIIMLAALRRYIKRQYVQFALWMSVSIMLKSFPILVFIPLILLIEKKLVRIFMYLILGLSSSIVYKIFFGANLGYTYTKAQLEQWYGFASRLTQNGMNVGMGFCAFFVVTFVVMCVWCFDKNMDESESWKYMIIIPLIVYSSLMIFVLWHPQWLAIIAPFIAMAVGVNTKRRSALYCEWGIGVMYCLTSLVYYSANVDNYMINNGILSELVDHQYSGITFSACIGGVSNISTQIIISVMVALILYFCYRSVVDISKMAMIDECSDVYFDRGIVLVRCATIYALCILFLFMYFYVG